jgi:hypothetical protein
MSADVPRPSAPPTALPRTASGPAAAGPGPAAARQRPDPRPMRLALGAGTLAAVSIMAAGLVRFPVATDDAIAAADGQAAGTLATARPEVIVRHRTRYVQLKPGQKAPRGAKVISGAVPTPRVVVTRIAARPATTRRVVTRRVVTRTRQSGR